MGSLALSLACGEYDRMRPLLDGRVEVEGVRLTTVRVTPAELFWRQLRHEEFDITEMSLSNYTMELSRNRDRFVGIPVFPHRMFRHSCIWIRTDGSVTRPEDLRGKRIGIPEYSMTMQLFVRGMLEHDYGVRPRDVTWVMVRPERVSYELRDVKIENVAPDTDLEELLVDGRVDALVTTEIMESSKLAAPLTRRLFEHVRQVEQDYYRRTKIYPIMHLVAIRRPVYEANRWLAPNLMKAFEHSKAMAYARLLGSDAHGAPICTLPWLSFDLEDEWDVFGGDPFPYGVEPNLPTLTAATDWSFEQGLSARHVAVDELFAHEVVDGWKYDTQQ